MLKSVFAIVFFVSVHILANPIAIMGDAGESSLELNQLKDSVKKEGVSSILMPGDNLYSGSYNSVWNNWKQSAFNFEIVAIGNHNDGYENEIKYFNMPGEYYSVLKDGARFIVLNSDNKKNVEAQFAWLRTELLEAKENLIFIVFHHPTFTISKTHTWTEKKDFQLQMRDILKQFGPQITALILGHDHLTEFMNFGSVPVIVAGSGREVRNEKPVSFTEDGFQIETKFIASNTQHWALLEIQPGSNEAHVSIVRVSDQKKVCSAVFKKSEMNLAGDCSAVY